ncbi:MAG: gamma-glutamyl-gamma-aminobutyrate hydrolase family protein [Lachnospiraceae bacterium]|nr:gamma-glutamyl-gamma-aminobutyrate hydrolase family protein [Lachnospiraceae bacterium]
MTVAGICVILMIAGMASSFEAKTKKQKKRTSGQAVKVAVVDKTYKAAAGTIRYARYCGMKPVWVHSGNVNPDNYDGLLIPGGGDVDPRLYGAKKRDPHVYGTDYGRSRLQIDVILKFARAGKPVLGICGGEQTINVAFGGTLKQHIGWHTYWRGIRISKKSWLRKRFGKRAVVYHFHHQCVNKLGKGLRATMWGTDNNQIEGVEHVSLPVYGVQWHPDQMGRKGKEVGQKFMAICREYRKRKK